MLEHGPEQVARDLLGRPVVEACGKRGADTRTPRLRRGVSGHDSCDTFAVFLARGRLAFFAPPRARLAFVAASPVVSGGAPAPAAAGCLAALPRPRFPAFRAAGAGGPPLGLAACSTRAGAAGAAAVSTTPNARRSGGGDVRRPRAPEPRG